MLNLRLCLLVFVVCCGSFCQASKTQPCVFQESEFYSYTEVLNCFHSIYLTDDVKYTTLETLKRALEVYTFYDIAHNSPDPNYPLQVNMQLGLSEIADRPYIYDMDFHEDLRYLFLQLRDAHTQYYLPTCYQNMQIRQAFAPIGIGSSEDTYEIKISPYFPDDLVQWYQFNANINLPDYVNYTITSINGVPALEYFMNYANTSIGISKDSGGRLNFAFTLPEPRDDIPVIMYGYWQQRTRRNPFPQTSSVIYNLKSPSGQSVTLTLPWTFKSLKTYSGVDSWKQDYYYDPSVKSILNVKEKHDVDIVERNFMEIEDFHARKMISLEKQEKLERVYGQLASEMTFELLVNTSHLTFWQLSDNKTLVMYLDTMGPGILSGYYPALIKGFQAAAERGLSRLIIDLSNNGGGNICLGRSLIAFLQKTGWPGEGQNWGPEDIPLSPLAEQLVQAAVKYDVKNTIWSPSFYANQQNQPIANNDTSYLLPGVPHVRGGMIRNYSKLIHINDCGNPGYVLNPAVDFSPEQTIIVTNGFCGSTCAMFACHLGLYDNVKTVVTGGIPGRDAMAYSAFPGGQVLDKEPLFQQLIELRQNVSYVPYDQIDPNDVVPRNIPTTADFRFCVREIYPLAQPNFTYGTKPMEFSFEDATHHLYNNEVTAVYPQYVWYEVLNYF